MGRWKERLRQWLGGRSARKSGKVTQLSQYRSKRTSSATHDGQHAAGTRCSRCRKIAGRLTFYVDEAGRPTGFCKACEPHAKRRDLLPL